VTSGLDRFWRSAAAGLCGSVAHTCLMTLKSWLHWLPTFEPYQDLQALLTSLVGRSVNPVVPWLLSYCNGAIVLGFLYSQLYRCIPGDNGAVKGAIFGLFGWIAMGFVFFPLTGRGLFATGAGLGILPMFFTLLMVLTYSVTLGVAYAAFNPDRS